MSDLTGSFVKTEPSCVTLIGSISDLDAIDLQVRYVFHKIHDFFS